MNSLRRLIRDAQGSVAIEFAFVGPILIAMVLGILQVGLILFTQVTLDGSARIAARLIRTGEAGQISGNAQTDFENALCANTKTSLVVDCTKIAYYVSTFTTFAAVASPGFPAQPAPQANGKPTEVFTTGSPGDIVGVRVSYPYTFLLPSAFALPFAGVTLNLAPSGSLSFVSTIIFRNEP
jgi:Flp pilus assembly protein TadG